MFDKSLFRFFGLQKVTPNGDGEVDIGCGGAFGGKNEDEDEPAAAADENAPLPVIDVVHNAQLEPVNISKALWKKYFMDFCKALKPKLEAEDAAAAAKFKANFPALKTFGLETVLNNFDDYEFYQSKAQKFPDSSECLIIPAKYEGEATSPDFYFMLDGLVRGLSRLVVNAVLVHNFFI